MAHMDDCTRKGFHSQLASEAWIYPEVQRIAGVHAIRAFTLSDACTVDPKNCVAAKEFSLSYCIGETTLNTTYTNYGNLI